jgi:integrase
MLADDYLDEYIKHHRQAKGQAEVRRLLTKYLAPIEEMQAEELGRADVYGLLSGMQDTPVQAGQVRAEMGAAWDIALDAGRIKEDAPNWWRLVMRGRLQSKGKMVGGARVGTSKRVLNLQEMRELLAWLPNFSRNVSDVLALYLLTGCRGSELVQIEAEEVTEEADGLWWTCPKAKTKNARHPNAGDLRVPLVGAAEAVVRRRVEQFPAGHLFPPPRRAKLPHIEQKAIQSSVWYHQPYSIARAEDARPRLTVTHWAPHDLRRSVRTQLAAMGCPADVAEAVLGHMQPGIQGIYNLHQYDTERRHWLTLLAERLQAR